MKLPKPLKCSDVSKGEILKALVSHELDGDTENRLLEHLKNCPVCLTAMASIVNEILKNEIEDYRMPFQSHEI